jgi:dihydroorotate dehydrogenase (fumarate)
MRRLGRQEKTMDLTTTYLGMTLKNPIVPSASPLSESVDNIRRLEDAGAAAVVMYSLFEEQITSESHRLDHYLSVGTNSFPEALDFFPEMEDYNTGPDEYLTLIGDAKAAVDIPIIGSLNGVSTGGWIEFAEKIEQAGADALELNIYFIPTSIHMTGADIEQMTLDVVHDVKKTVNIPVAVKLSPYFSATANMAYRLVEAGADGLVLFNRFYQPDFDLEKLEVVPNLVLSSPVEMRLPLRWVAILYGQVQTDFAITSGIHRYTDALKAMMAGANVAMMASELLKYGPDRIGVILAEIELWMEENSYESITQMRGSMSQQHVVEPAAFERANYMKTLQSWRQDPAGQGFKIGLRR